MSATQAGRAPAGPKRKLAAEAASSKRAKENHNAGITRMLTELAEHERNVVRNIHKYNIYRKAATAIAAHPVALASGAEAQKLPGVGKKIGQKIDEWLATGKLKKLDKIQASPEATAIQLIAGVVGFGPAAAHRLVQKGVTSLEALEKEKGLTTSQRIGLNHYHDFNKRIPRAEVDRLKQQAFSAIRAVCPTAQAEVCGSYRRGAETSGDIDILVAVPASEGTGGEGHKGVLGRIVEQMKEGGLVTDVLSCGESKFMGVCVDQQAPSAAAYRRIDVRIVNPDQWAFALLYFTGSDETNKSMRRAAIDMQMKLSEYSLLPMGENGTPGKPLVARTEAEIFELLGMKYLPPADR